MVLWFFGKKWGKEKKFWNQQILDNISAGIFFSQFKNKMQPLVASIPTPVLTQLATLSLKKKFFGAKFGDSL